MHKIELLRRTTELLGGRLLKPLSEFHGFLLRLSPVLNLELRQIIYIFSIFERMNAGLHPAGLMVHLVKSICRKIHSEGQAVDVIAERIWNYRPACQQPNLFFRMMPVIVRASVDDCVVFVVGGHDEGGGVLAQVHPVVEPPLVVHGQLRPPLPLPRLSQSSQTRLSRSNLEQTKSFHPNSVAIISDSTRHSHKVDSLTFNVIVFPYFCLNIPDTHKPTGVEIPHASCMGTLPPKKRIAQAQPGQKASNYKKQLHLSTL